MYPEMDLAGAGIGKTYFSFDEHIGGAVALD
jgi:hypothetical protein